MACPYMRNCSDYNNQTKNYKRDFCNDSLKCKKCGYYPWSTQEMKNNTQNYQKREANDKAANAYLIKCFIGVAIFIWIIIKFG